MPGGDRRTPATTGRVPIQPNELGADPARDCDPHQPGGRRARLRSARSPGASCIKVTKNIDEEAANTTSWVTLAATAPDAEDREQGGRGAHRGADAAATQARITVAPASSRIVCSKPQPTLGAQDGANARLPAGGEHRFPEVDGPPLPACRRIEGAGTSPAAASATIGRLTTAPSAHPGPSARKPRAAPRSRRSRRSPPQTPSAVLRSLPSLKVVVGVEEGAGRSHDRGTDALRDPSADEQPLVLSSSSRHGSRDQDRPATAPAASRQVSGATTEEQETAPSQVEDVHAGGPLQVLLGEVQVVLKINGSTTLTMDVEGDIHELNRAQQRPRHAQPVAQDEGLIKLVAHR